MNNLIIMNGIIEELIYYILIYYMHMQKNALTESG